MPSAYRLRRGGPSPRARLPAEVKVDQGRQVYRLHYGHGLGFRAAGARLDMSASTAWRRFWFYQDYVMYPRLRNLPRRQVPPQRGTRECPSGEPPILGPAAGSDRPESGRTPSTHTR